MKMHKINLACVALILSILPHGFAQNNNDYGITINTVTIPTLDPVQGQTSASWQSTLMPEIDMSSTVDPAQETNAPALIPEQPAVVEMQPTTPPCSDETLPIQTPEPNTVKPPSYDSYGSDSYGAQNHSVVAPNANYGADNNYAVPAVGTPTGNYGSPSIPSYNMNPQPAVVNLPSHSNSGYGSNTAPSYDALPYCDEVGDEYSPQPMTPYSYSQYALSTANSRNEGSGYGGQDSSLYQPNSQNLNNEALPPINANVAKLSNSWADKTHISNIAILLISLFVLF